MKKILTLILFLSLLVLSGCTVQHKHSYHLSWSNDAQYHWHSATCDHADELADKAEHTWNQGVETQATTETKYGIMTYSCSVCGYVGKTWKRS